MSDDHRGYSQEEVNAILQRALQKQSDRPDLLDRVGHDELMATAREIGIDPAALDVAIADERRERAGRELRAEWKRRRTEALRGRALTWALVNTLCLAIDLLTAGGPWFQWVLVPWGVVLLFSAVRLAVGPSDRDLERLRHRQQRELARREQRERRELSRRQWQRRAAAIEQIIDEGATLLLSQLKRHSGGSAAGHPRSGARGELRQGSSDGETGSEPPGGDSDRDPGGGPRRRGPHGRGALR